MRRFFFFRELLSSDTMKDYNRARVYLDKNYKSQEHFTVSAALHWKNDAVFQHPHALLAGFYWLQMSTSAQGGSSCIPEMRARS